MKNTVVPTTKKLLGALAVIGLMSVVLAKFFSDLAFADDAPVFVGTYQYNSCLQQLLPVDPSADPDCVTEVLVYRADDGSLISVQPDKGGTIGKIVTPSAKE